MSAHTPGQHVGPTGTYEGQKIEIERLTRINAALLEALERAVKWAQKESVILGSPQWAEDARAAIAQAKGTK